MRTRPSLLAVLLALLLGGGCATTPEGPKRLERARDYYPLAVGNSWTYRITPAPPDMPEGEIAIVSEEDGFFALNVGGKLAARGTSITDGTRNLLEEPLEVGHAWVAVPAPSAVERYKIIAVDAEVKIPSGLYRNCVQVQIEQEVTSRDGVKGRLLGVWSYAPGVGPVHFIQNIHVGDAPPQKNIEYTLVRYRAGGVE